MEEQKAQAYWQEDIRASMQLVVIASIVSCGFEVVGVDLLDTIAFGGVKLEF